MSEKKTEYVNYRVLGNSGMKVFPLCLGCMPFGTKWGATWGVQSEVSDIEKMFQSYFEVGGNYLDTACNYQAGESEVMVGKLLKKFKIDRDKVVIATKYTSPMDPHDPNYNGNHKKNLKRSFEGSLKRLDTDYIDLYYVHYWDWTTGSDFVMRSLNDLVRSGRILHIGISDAPAWVMTKMNMQAKFYGLEPYIVYQGEYSLIERSVEQEIVPACKDFKMSICPWGSVGGGVLAGKRKKEDMKRGMAKMKFNDTVIPIQEKLVEIAEKRKVSAAQVAMNWVLNRPCVDSLLIGPRTYAHFEEALGVLKFKLDDVEIRELEEVSKNFPAKIFPTKYVGNSYSTNNWFHLNGKHYHVENQE